MKRILLFSLLTVFGVLALQAAAPDPWAEDDMSVAAREGRRPMARAELKQKETREEAIKRKARDEFRVAHPEKVTLIPMILRGEIVKIGVYPPSLADADKYRWATDLVYHAYRDWFKNAVDTITKSNRRKEFADVLPILKKGVSMQFVDFVGKQYDVWVSLEEDLKIIEKECGEGSVACEFPGTEEIPISVEVYEKGNYSDLLHEIGHTLGLGEAYDPEEEFMLHTHRSKQQITETVMHVHDTPLTADDADGLINIIDSWRIKQMQQRYPSNWCQYVPARVKNGWDSLHKGQDGQSTDRFAMGTSESLLSEAQKCPQEDSAELFSQFKQEITSQMAQIEGRGKSQQTTPIKRPVKPMGKNRSKQPPSTADND